MYEYIPTTPYSMYFVQVCTIPRLSPRATVVLELPQSTRTWQRVRLASQLTLGRRCAVNSAQPNIHLDRSQIIINYAASSWKYWSWTISHGGKQKEFLSCSLKVISSFNLTLSGYRLDPSDMYVHTPFYIHMWTRFKRSLLAARAPSGVSCLHECLNQSILYVWSLCREPRAGHTLHSFYKNQEND